MMTDCDIKYTDHAFERMAERGITRPMIEAAIVAGECTEQRRGAKRYTLCGLVVVVDSKHVVTAFFDSDARPRGQWSPKKRQRRCRAKQHKPTWISGRGHINISLANAYLRQAERV